jgi:hypothetical protein
MAATVTRIRRFERGLGDGTHHSCVSARYRQDAVVYHARCSCGWESPDTPEPTRAQESFLHHLRRAGIRAAV